MTENTRWVVIDDRDSRIRYSGTWSTSNGIQHNNHGNYGQVYENTLHSTTTSSSVSFTFTGSAAKVLGSNDVAINDAGVSDPDWDCTLDGRVVPEAKTKPFRYRENNWEFCDFRNLSPSQHSISLVVKTRGRAFWFDRIHYRPTNVVENETVLVTRDDADIVYNEGGKWGPLAQVAYFTPEPGGSVTLPFIGTGIELWAMAPTERPHGAAQAVYSIDGGEDIPFIIREVGNISDYNRKLFETAQLSPGRHTIKVTYRGTGSLTPLVIGNFLVTGGTNRRAPEPVTPRPSPSTTTPPSTSSGTSDDGGSNGGSNSNGNSSSRTEESGNKTETPSEVSSKVIFIKPSETGEIQGAPTPDINGNSLGNNSDANPVGSSSKSSNNTGAIIGGVLGALAILLVIFGLVVWMKRRRAKQRRTSSFGFFNPAQMANSPYQQQPPTSNSSAALTSQQPWAHAHAPPYMPSNSNAHSRTLSDPRSEVPSIAAGHVAGHHIDDVAPPQYRY